MRLVRNCIPAVVGIGLLLGHATARADGISVTVNGEPVRFATVGPQEIQGRVLVPLRGVLEKLGAFVDWVPSTHTVMASRGNMDLQLQIGSRVAQVNGRQVTLDVPAMTLGGSTMVPLRFVGETLGADVRWDGPARTVLITTADGRSGTDRATHEAVTASRPNTGPEPTTERAFDIRSVTHNHPSGWLRAGQVLDVTVRGTPGGAASFRIPGVTDMIPMREMSPGVYEGSWTVPADKPLNLSDAAVIASLKDPHGNGASAPLVQSGDLLRIGTVPPTIADLNPAPGTAVSKPQPLISATFSGHGGSAVAPDRLRILMDGRDVTSEATVTGQFFTYTPKQPLPGGKHTTEVWAYDQAGNEAHQKWDFEVPAQRAEQARGVGSIVTNASGTMQPGDIVNVHVVGEPGGYATWSLGPIKDRFLHEDQPGVYNGAVRIRPGDAMENAHLVVTLAMPNGTKYSDTNTRAVTVKAGPPAAPVITSPSANGRYSGGPLVVRGAATPNSTVRLKIDYASRILGVLGVHGTAAQQDVHVNADGNWASEPIDLTTVPGGRNTEYTITAVAVNAANQQSPATTMTLR